MRKQPSKTLETPENPDRQINNDQAQSTETQKISGYEQSREQRIKENLERMQKLGIMDLSLQLKSTVPRKRAPKNPSGRKPPTPLPPSGPTRRSSRLQNTTPVSYTEVDLSKKNVSLEEELLLERGFKQEIYTEEHEKLLGSTERSWTLFVDGIGKDGKRIYDPVKGKTCHQCRQKTLGHRTRCSKCNMVQGQFCGDCLYMRYGEHVLEANENPDWVCPVCRGICNCSLCRQAKGWAPTGSLYRKISRMGFKSVAHYLIQTRRGQDTTNQVSATAKRSLPFSDTEAVSTESLDINDNLPGSLKPQSEDSKDDQLKGEREHEMPSNLDLSSKNQSSARRPLHFSNMEALHENLKVSEVDHKQPGEIELQPENTRDDQSKIERENETQICPNPSANQPSEKSPLPFADMGAEYDNVKVSEINLGLSERQSDDKRDDQVDLGDNKRDDQFKGKEEKELQFTDKEPYDGSIAAESGSKLKKKRALVTEPSQDSIAVRLRQRHRIGNEHDNGLPKSVDMEAGNNILSDEVVEKEKEALSANNEHGNDNAHLESKPNHKKNPALSTAVDGIAGRLRQRRKEGNEEALDVKQAINNASSGKKDERNKKLTVSISECSIAKRLRPRLQKT